MSSKAEPAVGDPRGPERLQAVQGMNDWMPPGSRRLRALEAVACEVLERHGYAEVRPPVVEHTQLFARSIGGSTDIVEKEMYTFSDRERCSLTLRPEGTAGVARAFVEHGVNKREPVTRWYYLGPMFRHERAQRGRYRQFYQLGAEAIGVAEPGIDAELIALLVGLLDSLGLPDGRLLINSLGCPRCRPGYRDALVGFFEPHRRDLCEDCQRRLQHNPLRVLDCKQERCQAVAIGAPWMLEGLCSGCRQHWDGLLADLSALEIGFEIDHRMVRGLDYYTRTTFEITSGSGELGSQKTIVGGGRYDGLIEQLGGSHTPAIGFGMGLERLLLALEPERPVVPRLLDVAFVTRGDGPRRAALPLARSLRGAGLAVDVDHRGTSIKSQMKRAGRLGVPVVAIVGDAELEQGVVSLRDMARSEQHDVPIADLLARVREILA